MFVCQVLPSQRQGNKARLYNAWVCLNKSEGWVLTGNWSCMAGLGSSCSHIAALLFKLEAAAHYQLTEQTAKTSLLCPWKASKKCVIPAPLSSIDFSRPRKGSLPRPQTSITHSRHYCCSNPEVGKQPLSKEALKAL